LTSDKKLVILGTVVCQKPRIIDKAKLFY